MENPGELPLAGDLLQRHSINELRGLVQSLQKDCGSKKSELQLMVGSKYHDFIESADAITNMHKAADTVSHSIQPLSSLGKEVIQQCQALLDDKVPQSVVKSIAQRRYHKVDLTAGNVWECLNCCEVFEAAELLVTAGILRSMFSSDNAMSSLWLSWSVPGHDQNGVCGEYSMLSTMLQQNSLVAETTGRNGQYLYQSGHDLSTLRMATLEDSFFLLLLANERLPSGRSLMSATSEGPSEGSCELVGPVLSPLAITNILTSMLALRTFHSGIGGSTTEESVFSKSLDPSMTAATYFDFMAKVSDNDSGSSLSKRVDPGEANSLVELLMLYLSGASERLYNAVDGMKEDVLSRAADFDKPHEVWADYVQQLLNAIRVLQQTILDVFMIFFHTQDRDDGSNDNGVAEIISSTLIESACANFSANILDRLRGFVAESSGYTNNIDKDDLISLNSMHPLSTCCPNCLTGVATRTSTDEMRRRIHEVWMQWMYGKRSSGHADPTAPEGNGGNLYISMVSRGGAAAVLSSACVFCLQFIKASPNSGGDVSALQNEVKAACASAKVCAGLIHPEDYGFLESGSHNVKAFATRTRSMTRSQRAHSEAGIMNSNDAFGAESDTVSDNHCSFPQAEAESSLQMWRKKLWNDACHTLLASYKPVATSSTATHSTSTKKIVSKEPTTHSNKPSDYNHLWSRVFRKPFLHQVESALHASSVSGLFRMQQRLLRAMYCVGVVVNITSGPKQGASEMSGEECSYAISVQAISTTRANSPSGSVHLYHLADELRSFLSQELLSLRTGIQLSDDDNNDDAKADPADKESSNSLARSVQVYSCQMIGQLVALVRCLGEVCRDAVSSNRKKSWSADDIGLNSTSSVGSSMYGELIHDWDNLFLDALLLIGRFSWVLKANGSFLYSSLSFSTVLSRQNKLGSSVLLGNLMHDDAERGDKSASGVDLTYYTSYDQLQSAFDIADSDGDGLITFWEAIEALQALCVDDDTGTSEGRSLPHHTLAQCLWPRNPSSLGNELSAAVISSSPLAGASRLSSILPADVIRFSLLEFKLLCSKYIPVAVQSQSSFRILHAALDNIIKLTHIAWARGIAQGIESVFSKSVSSRFIADDNQLNSVNYKESWVNHAIEDEGDSNASVILPTAPSIPMRDMMHSLLSFINTKMSSVDTYQKFFSFNGAEISHNETWVNVYGEPVLCLVEYASVQIVDAVVAGIGRSVNALLQQLDARLVSSEINTDDTAMIQILFDLLVFRKVFQCYATDDKNALIDKAVSFCNEHIDPIMVHLCAPLLESNAKKYCVRKKLLINLPTCGRKNIIENSGKATEDIDFSICRPLFSSPAKTANDLPQSDKEEKKQRFSLYPLPFMVSSMSGPGLKSSMMDEQHHESIINGDVVDSQQTKGENGKSSNGTGEESQKISGSTTMLSLGNSITGLTSYLTRSGGSTAALSDHLK